MDHREWGNPESAEKLFYFLHGFPGIGSRQIQWMAEFIYEKTKVPCALPFSDGLTVKPGKFSFLKILKNNEAYLLRLLQNKKTCKVVGHSWGGLQALYMATKFTEQVQTLVLISPLMRIPSVQIGEALIASVKRERPQVQFEDDKTLHADLDFMQANMQPEQLIAKLNPKLKVTYLQAKYDTQTPLETAQKMVPLFKSPISYEELEDDHGFNMNREALLQKVLAALKF